MSNQLICPKCRTPVYFRAGDAFVACPRCGAAFRLHPRSDARPVLMPPVGRGEEEYGPEEEHDGEASADGGKGVAAAGHQHGRRGEPREGVGKQLVEGGSRGMAYLKEIGDGDKFATVPETDCGFECEEVNGGGEDGQEPADYQFTTDLLKISSHSSVTISSTRACSTEEKSRAAL